MDFPQNGVVIFANLVVTVNTDYGLQTIDYRPLTVDYRLLTTNYNLVTVDG